MLKRRMLVSSLLLAAFALIAVACGPAASSPAPAAGGTSAPAPSGEKKVINAYFGDDTNITDWISNKVVPAFEKAYPQYKVNVVLVRGVGNGVTDIAQRAKAAMDTNADPQAELLAMDAAGAPDLVKAGLFLKLDASNVPNYKNIIKAAYTSDYSVSYRGSQVLLGYDSTKVKDGDVPKTFADLLKWIKANPGKFVYCRPDKGGSGGNFVIRAIYETTGKDPTIFKAGDPDPALLAKFDAAWALLRDIHTSIYDNGAYPAGNQPVLDLLANGSVSMATVWSDQALQGLARKVLPATVKLSQLTDVPFPGGYSTWSVPKNGKNVQGALDFINFTLSVDQQVSVVKDIGGFPAVDWGTLPKELQQQYTSVITTNVPIWPGGKWDAERNKGWYEKVATNIKQGS